MGAHLSVYFEPWYALWMGYGQQQARLCVGLQFGPEPGGQPRYRRGQVFDDKQAVHHAFRRVDRQVLFHGRREELIFRTVGVGVVDAVADVGDYLGLEQVIHIGVGVLFVRRGLGHHHHVQPQRRAFLRDRVGNLDTVFGFFRTGGRLHHVAIETDHRADIAVGQVTDVLGRV